MQYNTDLSYRYIRYICIYTHFICTSLYTIHFQTLLYSFRTVYILGEQYSLRLTAYINICSLFTPLTAAFPTVLYSSPRLFWLSLLSGKERKREKEEGRGRGKCFSAEIRTFLPPLYCTYCTNSQYILGLHLTIT